MRLSKHILLSGLNKYKAEIPYFLRNSHSSVQTTKPNRIKFYILIFYKQQLNLVCFSIKNDSIWIENFINRYKIGQFDLRGRFNQIKPKPEQYIFNTHVHIHNTNIRLICDQMHGKMQNPYSTNLSMNLIFIQQHQKIASEDNIYK